MGDGLPCLLSGDAFFECVVDSDVAHRQEEQDKIERLHIREERAVLLVEWGSRRLERQRLRQGGQSGKWRRQQRRQAQKSSARSSQYSGSHQRPCQGPQWQQQTMRAVTMMMMINKYWLNSD